MKLLNTNSMKDVDKAISKAVDECIEEGVLKDILETQKKEGFDLVLTDVNGKYFPAIFGNYFPPLFGK